MGSRKGVVQEEAKSGRVDNVSVVSKPTSDVNGARACDEHEVKMPVEMCGGDVVGVEKMDISKGDGIDELVAGGRDKPDMEVKESPEVDVVDEIVTEVKVPKSSSRTVMYNELPNLKLLEGVEISGTVVYVSPLGGVWFCPQWIQAPLDTLSMQVDVVAAENKLVSMCRNNMREGILCIARSPQDGELYRARIVSIDSNKVTVAFIDFGNSDPVSEEDVYELPQGLEMLAPASAEVVLARDLPKQNTQQVMEETLMEAENLILVLEEESGVKVGKFYSNGKEVKWDMMVETKKVIEKDRIDEENNEEDVVVEEEETVLRNNNVQDKVEGKTVGEVKPLKKPDPSVPRLIRLVPSLPFNIGVEESVFVVHVESTKIVWVSRESDEVRISLLMDKLARLSEEFKPAQRMKKGAVYGTRFSEDGELYRAVLKNVDESGALVQFIDFGNKEMKEEHELFDIPVEIGSEPAGAISVELKTSMEDNEENRAIVEQMLEGENLSVTLPDDGYVFKKGGEVLAFERVMSRQSTSSDMFTMRDVTQSLPVDPVPEVILDKSPLLNGTEKGLKTTEVAEIKPTIDDEKETTGLIAQDTACTTRTTPGTIGNSVNPVVRVSSKAPNTALLSSPVVTEAVSSVTNCTPLPSNICTPHVGTVPILVPVAPQPVPTRNFAKAISDLQNQLQAKTAKKDTQVKQKERGSRLSEWSEGDLVVARRPDGVWMNATIVTMNTAAGKAKVTCDGEEVIVELINVRSPSLPVEALNLIDQGLSEKNITRQKGDGESREKSVSVPPAVVGKVKDWMDKNIAQLRQDVANSCLQDGRKAPNSPSLESTSKQSLEQIPLPPSNELASYR